MEKLELILHPIRMQIIMVCANQRKTPQEIAAKLPNIAQTTLYRHINLLIDGGILTVTRESKIRGTVERELALVTDATIVTPADFAKLSPEQQAQHFTTFISMIVGDFKLAQEYRPTTFPLAIYGRRLLYASIEEIEEIDATIDRFLDSYRSPEDANTPAWWFSGIVVPKPKSKSTKDEDDT